MKTSMTVIKQSTLTGATNMMELPIDLVDYMRYTRGEGLVQDIFPQLDDDEREFLISGVTASEWDEAFGEDGGDFVPSDEIVTMNCELTDDEVPF